MGGGDFFRPPPRSGQPDIPVGASAGVQRKKVKAGRGLGRECDCFAGSGHTLQRVSHHQCHERVGGPALGDWRAGWLGDAAAEMSASAREGHGPRSAVGRWLGRENAGECGPWHGLGTSHPSGLWWRARRAIGCAPAVTVALRRMVKTNLRKTVQEFETTGGPAFWVAGEFTRTAQPAEGDSVALTQRCSQVGLDRGREGGAGSGPVGWQRPPFFGKLAMLLVKSLWDKRLVSG